MTDIERIAEELVAEIAVKYERYLSGMDYYRNRKHWDETHAAIITAALKRVRDEAALPLKKVQHAVEMADEELDVRLAPPLEWAEVRENIWKALKG